MKAASIPVLSSVALALVACADREAPIAGTQSLRVTVLSPADTGSSTHRLDDSARDVVFQVEAIDARGQVDRGFAGSVDVLVFSLGTVDPLPKPVVMQDGQGDGQTTLPATFGQTYLWVEARAKTAGARRRSPPARRPSCGTATRRSRTWPSRARGRTCSTTRRSRASR